nr:hypothetical protein Iba_chr03aCG9030 [Ipomoea batatas]
MSVMEARAAKKVAREEQVWVPQPEPRAPDDPKAADDPEAVRTTSRTKTKPSETWNQKMEDHLEAMNDPEAADDLEVLGVKAKHKFRGMKAKHEFRGFEEPKQSQVRLGTKRWRTTSRP